MISIKIEEKLQFYGGKGVGATMDIARSFLANLPPVLSSKSDGGDDDATVDSWFI